MGSLAKRMSVYSKSINYSASKFKLTLISSLLLFNDGSKSMTIGDGSGDFTTFVENNLK